MRNCQVEAIQNLEFSFAQARPRALIQMASGSGKTFAAVTFVYRLIRFANARRVLFLVDRNTLGRQTLQEFQQYRTPDDGRKFTELYNVQRLASKKIDSVSRVCITTIQRLYAMLKNEEIDPEIEEQSIFEIAPKDMRPVEVQYNPNIPIEMFDFIITDECHRSIYHRWGQVLEYFDGFIIGLTATPSKQTLGFFNQNLVMEYGHDRAVADGVNVGYEVYRIATQITQKGTGRGNLSSKVYARRGRQLVLVDSDAESLQQAHQKLKGRVVHETVAMDNVKWIKEEMRPEDYPDVVLVDFDAFGRPAEPAKAFLDKYPAKRSMYVAFTDGSSLHNRYIQDEEGRKWLRSTCGVNFSFSSR